MEKKFHKPEWLRINPFVGDNFAFTKNILKKHSLNTVCVEANCPNISDCWQGSKTATFLILGSTCTRACRFCDVKSANIGEKVNSFESSSIACAVKEMGLKHVVLTSVDRDDLKDQGASHFADCISEIKKVNKNVSVEVLIPDFSGRDDLIKLVVDAKPDVIGHNIEVVESLQKKARDRRASYKQSLGVLRKIKELDSNIYTKSSIMLGLGELEDEVIKTMNDLRGVNCDFLTIGQYLRPTRESLEVVEFVHPVIFKKLKIIGEKLGFLYVFSGPFVRSSYKAGDFFVNLKK